MNENIDLTKILKDCPEGFELYSIIYGTVTFSRIVDNAIEYVYLCKSSYRKNKTYKDVAYVSLEGKYNTSFNGECTLFPSKDQRDWSKFTAPWYKKERKKFYPKTLQPFDKVLVKGCVGNTWKCGLFSHVKDDASLYKYSCAGDDYAVCIPYNEDTKHLVGTKEEAPEYYRYWED